MSQTLLSSAKDTLRALVADRRYWDTRHPEHEDYHVHVTWEFARVYPGIHRSDGFDTSAEGGPDASVHVRTYTRRQDGQAIQVAEHDRAAPGTGAAQNGAAKSSTAQGTKSPIPNPVIRNDKSGYGDFGTSRKGADGSVYSHLGIDIEAVPGTTVNSPVDGKIDVRPAYKNHDFNDEYKAVTVTDKVGREFIFRYVTPNDSSGQVTIRKGDKVQAGQPIGSVQNRANKDKSGKMKNHIHVEIKENGRITNPTKVIQDWQKQ